ncbi:hypothetical protein TCAL_16768 [Tigriopus californicus]|uniref:Uncharacterized protein n=1 Tax=Tigriopus californicus TaxID=6832 RepID=A0A553PSK3_TIGCA|nr:hypothetical protein TCAL_16768 [Tigriopus californicus]
MSRSKMKLDVEEVKEKVKEAAKADPLKSSTLVDKLSIVECNLAELKSLGTPGTIAEKIEYQNELATLGT